jgi:methylenetetrahydrofolate reductase (NADPH)
MTLFARNPERRLSHAVRDAALSDAVRFLTTGYTLEVTPKQVDRLAALRGTLPEGSGVYITDVPGAPHEALVAAAERIAAEGFHPIPHLAARNYASLEDVAGLLRALRERAQVSEMLVIAGSTARPAGSVESSLDVLRSGLLEEHGIRRVGVAGHPEGHPDVGADALAAAVEEKNRFAAESGIETYILTQFCFSPEPYVRYERELREAGNRLPVRPGLPGVTSMRTLLRYAVSCGIGPSLGVLRKQARGIATLVSSRSYTPDALVAGLAEAVAEDRGSLLRSLHFFPFGGLEDTVHWVAELSQAAGVGQVRAAQ